MSRMASLVIPWKEAWRHPRLAQQRALREGSFLSLLPLPLAAGVVASLTQGAQSNLGARGISVAWVLLAGIVLGSLWGLLTLFAMSGLIYLTARRDEAKVPFREIRTVVALSRAPLATAFLFWLTASLTLGPDLYVDMTVVPSSFGPVVLLEVGLLYLATAACWLWSVVVLIVGIAEIQRSSLWRAVGTLAEAVIWPVLAGVLIGLIYFLYRLR
ncbi:MAG TPA: hypothetical protein VMT29_04510 [Steroidobacteraceae bacterium]|nr:hypothetical protein [Steroidobacteraceae bacterium]